MKSSRSTIAGSVDRPHSEVRFYLFHGPDSGESRALGERLLKGLGAEKSVVTSQAAGSDPALLADEAGAIGLFGEKRAIWIEPAADEITPAVEALLGAPAVESAVVAIGGALRRTSALVKLAETHPHALAHISYEPSERDAVQIVEVLARAEGLWIAPGIAAQIAAAAGNDRGIIAQELAKIALFLGADTSATAEVDRETLDEIGAGTDGDAMRLGDIALSGDVAALARELDTAGSDVDPVSVIRALQRRLLLLAPIRARVDAGERPHDAVTSAGKSVFWKDKERVARMVTNWDSRALARVIDRSGELERRLMRRDSPPDRAALGEELVAVARMARRKQA